jgi:hypothetical protein
LCSAGESGRRRAGAGERERARAQREAAAAACEPSGRRQRTDGSKSGSERAAEQFPAAAATECRSQRATRLRSHYHSARIAHSPPHSQAHTHSSRRRAVVALVDAVFRIQPADGPALNTNPNTNRPKSHTHVANPPTGAHRPPAPPERSHTLEPARGDPAATRGVRRQTPTRVECPRARASAQTARRARPQQQASSSAEASHRRQQQQNASSTAPPRDDRADKS